MGLDPLLHRESWNHIKGWYKAVVYLAPPPVQVNLEWITAERVELYNYVPLPGMNIPISMQPFLVENLLPTKDEIEWAVTRLCNHRSRGMLGMRAEHLMRWMAAARKEEKDAMTTARAETTDNRGNTAVQPSTEPTEAYNWEMVVELIRRRSGRGNWRRRPHGRWWS